MINCNIQSEMRTGGIVRVHVKIQATFRQGKMRTEGIVGADAKNL